MSGQFTELDMSYHRVPFDWESRKQWLEIPFPIEEYHARVAAVRARMAEAGLDALVVHGAPGWLNGDVRWISNFLTAIGNTVVVLPADGPLMLTTDSILHSAPMHSFVHHTWIADVRPGDLPGTVVDPQGVGGHVRDFLLERGLHGARIGVVGGRFIPAAVVDEIRAALPGTELTDGQMLFWQAKQIKSPREIEFIEHAGRVTAAGLEAVMELVRPGVTELELSAAAHEAMALGSDWVGHCMVAAGPRSGLKHLYPAPRPIEDGDLVFMDMGVHYQGYFTDTARTLCAGAVGRRQREILQCGLDMFEAVLAEARPGARVADLQDLAQGIAEDAGYGARYWPTGIGTNIAELPSLHWKSETVLQPGHVFALEPMIVIQGLGCGVMEDQVLVTDTGARSLIPARRETW